MSGDRSARPVTRDRANSPAPRDAEAPQTASTVDPTASDVDFSDAGTVDSRRHGATSPDRYVAPAVGPSDLAELPGPFSGPQLSRIDEALTLGTRETALLFSVYVGTLQEPARRTAEELAARLPAGEEEGAVLVAVSPGQRVLQIVTTGTAVSRLPNRTCALAALGMRAAFAGGDLTAGIVNGIRLLADAAGANVGRV